MKGCREKCCTAPGGSVASADHRCFTVGLIAQSVWRLHPTVVTPGRRHLISSIWKSSVAKRKQHPGITQRASGPGCPLYRVIASKPLCRSFCAWMLALFAETPSSGRVTSPLPRFFETQRERKHFWERNKHRSLHGFPKGSWPAGRQAARSSHERRPRIFGSGGRVCSAAAAGPHVLPLAQRRCLSSYGCLCFWAKRVRRRHWILAILLSADVMASNETKPAFYGHLLCFWKKNIRSFPQC